MRIYFFEQQFEQQHVNNHIFKAVRSSSLSSVLFLLKVSLFVFSLSCFAQNRPVNVSFIINSSDNISPNNIFVAGSLQGMGPWEPNKIRLVKSGNGSWIGTVRMPAYETIAIRFTQGTWDYNEVDATGEPILHQFVLTRDTMIQHRVRHWSIPGQNYFPSTESSDAVVQPTPEPKIIKPPFQFVRRHEGLESDGVNPRNVTVYLPKSYETEENRRYPVLYVHDGLQRFYSTTTFDGNDWAVPQIALALMDSYQIEDIIVVSIHNQNDYLFKHFSRNINEPYRNFLSNHLKTYIDRKYRTKPEPNYNCTMGSDYGALWALALAWENSDAFGKAICFSPILEKPRQYFAYVFQISESTDYKPIEVYLDNGSNAIDNRKQNGLDRMKSVLEEKGVMVYYEKQFDKVWNPQNTGERIINALLKIY